MDSINLIIPGVPNEDPLQNQVLKLMLFDNHMVIPLNCIRSKFKWNKFSHNPTKNRHTCSLGISPAFIHFEQAWIQARTNWGQVSWEGQCNNNLKKWSHHRYLVQPFNFSVLWALCQVSKPSNAHICSVTLTYLIWKILRRWQKCQALTFSYEIFIIVCTQNQRIHLGRLVHAQVVILGFAKKSSFIICFT